jgi:hypothetical protein
MRRKVIVGFVAACLLPALTATDAEAIIGRGWLERLSGPGPFAGLVVEARLLCVTLPRTSGRSDEDKPETHNRDKSRWPGLAKRIGNSNVWWTPVDCHFLPKDEPRLHLGFSYGRFGSEANLLDYGERQLTGDDTKVGLTTTLFTADFQVNRAVDVGAGIGWGRFRPAELDDLFSPFSRFAFQPLRVTMRPLAILGKDPRLDILVLRADATKFNGAFIAEDFGATPGSFNEPGEILWSWQIKIDLTPFAFR